jgi:hypothetical protein
VNDAIIAEAQRVLPTTGYDRSQLYLTPSNIDNSPAAPVNIIANATGGPSLGTGSVVSIASPKYKNASIGVSVSKNAGANLKAGIRVILETGITSVTSTDTGSGRKYGDKVLTATVTNLKTGPYGTSDNTYATADQYTNFNVTALYSAAKQNTIKLLKWNTDLSVGLKIKGTVYSNNGTPSEVFPANTTITGLNKTLKTVTVSNQILNDISEGTVLDVAYDFFGIFNSVTTELVASGQRTIIVRTWKPDELSVGDVIIGKVADINGDMVDVFSAGTTITSINAGLGTFTVSTPTLAGLPAGSILKFAFGDGYITNETMGFRADTDPRFQFIKRASPRSFGYVNSIGSGDGQAPNGEPTGTGITFPGNPKTGDYFLRTDYLPQKLFRWSGQLWVEISQKVRTETGTGTATTARGSFQNNTARITTSDGSTIPSRQGLSSGLRPD